MTATSTLLPPTTEDATLSLVLGRHRIHRRRRTVAARRRSFDELYNGYYEAMVRLACGLIDRPTVAEDIVQDSFHQLWQRWDSVSSPASYLRTSVVNGCHNELRRRRVRRASAHKLVDSPPADSDYLADALADIGESRRHALVLRFYGGRTMDEIAQAMNIPTGTAKSLIHRGLADLRGSLGPGETSHSPA